ncbi:hypothetical protein PENSPDRAFT_652808 [Peniophora sp. CONT]|nr:hypothetical protein PENSPDRAFT_652808 [Peniophora sp. CONT]
MSWQSSFAALLALALLWFNRADSLQIPPFIPCEHACQSCLSIAARVLALCSLHLSSAPPPHPYPAFPQFLMDWAISWWIWVSRYTLYDCLIRFSRLPSDLGCYPFPSPPPPQLCKFAAGALLGLLTCRAGSTCFQVLST